MRRFRVIFVMLFTLLLSACQTLPDIPEPPLDTHSGPPTSSVLTLMVMKPESMPSKALLINERAEMLGCRLAYTEITYKEVDDMTADTVPPF